MDILVYQQEPTVINIVNHLVCSHQVDYRFNIRLQAEILVIIARKTYVDSVMCVKHRRDSVESEAVKHILIHPIADVRQQESQNFVAFIIETSAIPLSAQVDFFFGVTTWRRA